MRPPARAPSGRQAPALLRSALLAGAGVVLVGALVLVGWVTDHQGLKSVLPGLVAMKANTSLALMLAGISLVLSARPTGLGLRRTSQGLAVAVLLIGLATTLEYALGWRLGIDELLFADRTGAYIVFPGRMSPYSAVTFLAAGVGLVALRRPGREWLSAVSGTITFAIGIVSLLGYAWNASELTTAAVVPPVAIHTAAAFVVLGAGVLLASCALRGWLPPVGVGSPQLDRPVALAWLGAFVAIVLVGGNAYRVSVGAATAFTAASQSQDIQTRLHRVYGMLSDAESAQRAYLLVQSDDRLTHYRAMTDRIATEVHQLRERLASDSVGARRASLLDALVTTRLLLLDRHLATHAEGGAAAAQAEIRTDDGFRLMVAMDSLVRVMDDAADAAFQRERAKVDARRRETLVGLLTLTVLGTTGFFICFMFIRQMTLRREEAEQALRASEEHLSVTLRSIGDGVLVTDREGLVTSLNLVAEELTGWTTATARGHPVEEVFDLRREGTDEAAPFPVREVLRTGVAQDLLVDHSELVSRDGTRRPVADSCAPIRDPSGAVVGSVLVFRDVTKVREATRRLQSQHAQLAELAETLEQRVRDRTEALRASEARFQDLFESAPDALLVVAQDGRVALANRRAEELFGRPRAVLVGLPRDELLPAAVDGRAGAMLVPPAMADDRADALPRPAIVRRPDGTEVPVEVLLSPTGPPDGDMMTCAVRDITDRVRLEEQYRQAQRMETVGQLAGGIAHDFNNLLSVINNTAELAAEELADDDPTREELAAIHEAGVRAATLTRQLLAFSRHTLVQPEVVDLARVVAELQPMLRRLLGEHIEIASRDEGRPAHVRIDPGQLEQVILNLGVNSRDAMPTGGTLTIETRHITLDEAYAREHLGIAPGAYVMLAVTDTGQGMDAVTRAHIFEPFFTTKSRGKGTGLGLATVYGIVKQAGGDIWAYSEVGQGTTMKVYLPEVVDATPATPVGATAPEPASGGESILVVEDEVALQGVVRRILEGAGYTVVVAGSGEEALLRLSEPELAIDLLLTDLVLPGMSGRVLSEHAAGLRPGLPTLLTSGYTDDMIVHHGVLSAGLAFISKPYSVGDLLRKVRQVLDG